MCIPVVPPGAGQCDSGLRFPGGLQLLLWNKDACLGPTPWKAGWGVSTMRALQDSQPVSLLSLLILGPPPAVCSLPTAWLLHLRTQPAKDRQIGQAAGRLLVRTQHQGQTREAGVKDPDTGSRRAHLPGPLIAAPHRGRWGCGVGWEEPRGGQSQGSRSLETPLQLFGRHGQLCSLTAVSRPESC